MTRRTLSVPAVSCRHCKMTIEGVVRALDGVSSANVDVTEKTVDLEFDEGRTAVDRIIAIIEDQGFEVATA